MLRCLWSIRAARSGVRPAALVAFAAWAALVGGALAQPGGGTPPGPGEPAWGAYRSGVGYVIGSDALLARAEAEGIDPRCLTTITVAWTDNATIVANLDKGLMEPIVENVPRADAQAAMYAESPYFNPEIDCVGDWASWAGGAYRTDFGRVDFGGGRTGRGTYGSSGDSAILYTLQDTTMTGTWVQPVSGRECDGEVGGSAYWGTIRFEFNDDFSAFEGVWDYCGDGNEAAWNGSLIE